MCRLFTAMLFATLLTIPPALAEPANPPQGQQHVARVPGKTVTVRTERYYGTRDYTIGHRPPNWNNRPRIVDRTLYHHNYVAVRRFHWRPYVRPHGWYYRRWVFGERLPSIFWTRNYWIAEYWFFGLPVPALGCEWIRYGNDALLIDIGTGEILQVMYGIFY